MRCAFVDFLRKSDVVEEWQDVEELVEPEAPLPQKTDLETARTRRGLSPQDAGGQEAGGQGGEGGGGGGSGGEEGGGGG